MDSSVNQVKQGYDEFKNDFNDGFNKIRGTTWSENSENEVESTFKNIRVDADKASDLFWGGHCVLDSNCAYFTIFIAVMKCVVKLHCSYLPFRGVIYSVHYLPSACLSE